jgi:RHS repeat-associated protein
MSYYRYDAFGDLAFGTPTSPFGYAGQYADISSSPSGFDNMRARWYQAQTGQFTTWDPAFAQTDQAYDYAGEDPVNWGDPSGLCPGQWYCGIENAIRQAATNTGHAWDCLTSACYATKTGSANLLAGAHNTLNYIAGLSPIAEPYLCSNADAFALGGQLPYWGIGLLVPGAGYVAGLDDPYFDGLPTAAEGGAAAADAVPSEITGFTNHGLEQALSRDGGLGVSQSAMEDAVANPVDVVRQANGTFKFVGNNATVVLNSNGQVVTTWATNPAGWRNVP